MAYDEKLAQRVRLILMERSELVEKKMFGGVGFLVNGNMACGINGDQLIVRMSEAEFNHAITQPHVRVFDLTGRPMKGWVFVGSSAIAGDNDLKIWVERGLQFARGLPPK